MSDDPYPSRCSIDPAILPRLDPILHGKWTPSSPLTREQTDCYAENGFIVLQDIFSSREVAILQEEATRLRNNSDFLENETTVTEPERGAIRSIFRLHKQSEIFWRLASDSRLSRVAQFLLNDDVYLHQSRLNYKPGFDGKEFYWHSDFETWHVEDGMPRMRAVSMSVLLTENTPANGPTMFLKGSHKDYISCVGETPDDHYKKSLKKQELGVPDREILRDMARNGVETPIGPPGSVVIFDCNTLHGSNSNISPYPRSNAFFVFNAASNTLAEPFGSKKTRPGFIAAREDKSFIEPIDGALIREAA